MIIGYQITQRTADKQVFLPSVLRSDHRVTRVDVDGSI